MSEEKSVSPQEWQSEHGTWLTSSCSQFPASFGLPVTPCRVILSVLVSIMEVDVILSRVEIGLRCGRTLVAS